MSAVDATLAETRFIPGEEDTTRVPKLRRLIEHLIAAEEITLDEAVQAVAGLTMAGNPGKVLTVNAGGDGLELVTPTYLANDSVTNARLANMAEATFKGRAAAAGVGDPQDLTVAQALTALGLSDVLTAWTAYTPTAAPTTGSFTATTGGRYKKIGKTVFVRGHIAISNNGTGAGAIDVSVPFAAANSGANAHQAITLREWIATGKIASGGIMTGTSTLRFTNYDNTYPGGTGHLIIFNGTYEAAT